MGKNFKSRECGKGIYQRKDGLYSARFVDRAGKRHEKYFQTVPEARNWIADAKYADTHAEVFVGTDITVDEWFAFWIENIVGDLAPNTLRNYRDRYKHNIQPVIGRIKLTDVKPMHCKKVFIEMDADYSGSTIRQAHITMGTIAESGEDERSHLQASHGRCSIYQAGPCGNRHQVPHPRRTAYLSGNSQTLSQL